MKKSVLEKMYLKEKKTVKKIADYFNLSEFGVYYYLKKYGIRKVERWERYGLKKFNQKQREYLIGGILGDDRLMMNRKRKYPFLRITHSEKQKAYVEWKYEIWKTIVPGEIKKISIQNNDNGKTYLASGFTTAAHPDFSEFFEMFYGSGRKRVTKKILDHLTPFSLAVWYMDDGYYNQKRGRVRLATNSFTYDENLQIQEHLQKAWRLSSNIGASDSGTHYIWLNTSNTVKFFKIVKDYIIPFFDYKIDRDRKVKWKALTSDELQYIKNNYNIESPRLIAHKLDRPLQTIYGAAWRIGVTQPRGGIKTYEKDL